MKGKDMNYSDLMKEAAQVVNDRHESYGDMQTIMERIAQIANLITGLTLTAHDVALIMHSVKLARMGSNRKVKDNYVDGINYFAFAGALANLDPDEGDIAEFAAKYAPPVRAD